MSNKPKKKSPNEYLEEYIKIYLGDRLNFQDELEVRFGTKYFNTLSKILFIILSLYGSIFSGRSPKL